MDAQLIIFHSIKNIFADEELDKNSVVEKCPVTAADGKNYRTQCYNLGAEYISEFDRQTAKYLKGE